MKFKLETEQINCVFNVTITLMIIAWSITKNVIREIWMSSSPLGAGSGLLMISEKKNFLGLVQEDT